MISSRLLQIILIILAACSLAFCVYRDTGIEKQYTSDLRNRIVGARMQMDGVSPYFYHWKSTESIRYYDPTNYGSMKLSDVTATPFFHQLLYPIANFPQRTISRIWLAFEYFAIMVMMLLALRLCKERGQKIAVVLIGLLFLYSTAWTSGIALGQLYITVPLLAMLFYFFITRRPLAWMAVLVSICAVSLVLIRPNTIVFFLPFLLLARQYPLKYKITLVVTSLLCLLLVFGSSRSRTYWCDYREAMVEHVKYHQYLSPTPQANEPLPVFSDWEGWNTAQIKKDQAAHPYIQNGENGNVFVLLKQVFHIKIPVWLLSALALTFIVFLSFLFLRRKNKSVLYEPQWIAILGYCFYMATDLLSPIHRIQYNACQWIFPLLLLAMYFRSSYKKIFIAGIIGGLLLNSMFIKLIPMQATIGEYLVFASILGLLLTHKPRLQS